ncbi:2-polyprenyl-6-methoxyphenol hydroxylase-like FAD-dependent oxidoreductase [Actinophytocola algeriensis]|uniref:2-polyprenyl-6-methoxyphenol hydroxylase-like FAD-dependent oxidoreductase n=2 Tax=Actinophytocola algeriensis TaxID=1768010 RepID=A0A7W7QG56_9PSEU|nr:2-polyprenyl-6-methoxyphenol hydroxylase-like FAD-dependent oxidoreductase [Actinophytocola algeriensis]MBE1473563.1 2-polyprenyl-6-methoxyphenol hydroxylase-like FAD-dependent oxidoreductase [Actinophytocola algeriensis]
MLFARQGYRVLLLEKVCFPQDTLSSHYIHQPGVALLDGWGLLDRLRDAGCRPIDHQSYEALGVRLDGFSLPADGHRTTYAPRRFVLDPVLADGAVASGVDFQESCTVNDLVHEDDRVVGVRYTTPRGAEATERARLVVGADGMRSLVARKAGAEKVVERCSQRVAGGRQADGRGFGDLALRGCSAWPAVPDGVGRQAGQQVFGVVELGWPAAGLDVSGSIARAEEVLDPCRHCRWWGSTSCSR